jgi:hypothetical protein
MGTPPRAKPCPYFGRSRRPALAALSPDVAARGKTGGALAGSTANFVRRDAMPAIRRALQLQSSCFWRRQGRLGSHQRRDESESLLGNNFVPAPLRSHHGRRLACPPSPLGSASRTNHGEDGTTARTREPRGPLAAIEANKEAAGVKITAAKCLGILVGLNYPFPKVKAMQNDRLSHT